MNVAAAAEALKESARAKNTPKLIRDTVDHVISYLVILNSSSPSPQALHKLSSVMRKPFVSLYTTFVDASLRLSSAIFLKILKDKIIPPEAVDVTLKAAWEGVEVSILSGVLDYLDIKSDGASKDTVSNFFYPTICGPLFLPAATNQIGPALRNTAYLLLSDTSCSHPANQHKLRDPNILGGERIGVIISLTKDFLAIESLLALFAWLLPPTNNSSSGRAKRTQFIQDVFGSQQRFQCSAEIVRSLESVSSSNWEETAVKIISALAAVDIAFPQPFSLDEIRACGAIFPQPNAADRLYVDNHALLANVMQDGDVYESLQVNYASVDGVGVVSSADGKIEIVVHLSSPPVVANSILKLAPDQRATISFRLTSQDTDRFFHALHQRNVNGIDFPGGMAINGKKRRQKSSLAIGVMLSGEDDRSRTTPPASIDDKIKPVGQVRGFAGTVAISTVPSPDNNGPMFSQAGFRTPIRLDNLKTSHRDLPDIVNNSHSRSVQSLSAPVDSEKNVWNVSLPAEQEQLCESIFGGSVEELSDCSNDEGVREKAQGKRTITDKTRKITRKRRVMISDPDDNATPKRPSRGGKSTVRVETPTKDVDANSKYRSGNNNTSSTSNMAKQTVPKRSTKSDTSATEIYAKPTVSTETVKLKGDVRVIDSTLAQTSEGDPKAAPKPTKVSRTSRKRRLNDDAIAMDSDYEPPKKKTRARKVLEPNEKSPAKPAAKRPRPVRKSKPRLRKSSPVPPGNISSAVNPMKVVLGEAGTSEKATSAQAKGDTKAYVVVANSRSVTNQQEQEQEVKPIPESAPAIPIAQTASDRIVQKSHLAADLEEVKVAATESASVVYISMAITGTNETAALAQLASERIETSSRSVTDHQEANSSSAGNITGVVKGKGKANETITIKDVENMVFLTGENNELREPSAPFRISESNLEISCQPPLHQSTPRKEIIMIDLTRDESPIRETESKYQVGTTAQFQQSLSTGKDVDRSVPDPPPTDENQHKHSCVTFASPIAQSVSPMPSLDQVSETGHCHIDANKHAFRSYPADPGFSRLRNSCGDMKPNEAPRLSSMTPTGNATSSDSMFHSIAGGKDGTLPARSVFKDLPSKVRQGPAALQNVDILHIQGQQLPPQATMRHGRYWEKRGQDVGRNSLPQVNSNAQRNAGQENVDMSEIVNVLHDIHSEIANGISCRFDNVKREVRLGRDRLLQDAVIDLQEMRLKCLKHHHTMVSLEEEHAAFCRKVAYGWEDVIKANQGFSTALSKVIEYHNRNISSKTFPKSLLAPKRLSKT